MACTLLPKWLIKILTFTLVLTQAKPKKFIFPNDLQKYKDINIQGHPMLYFSSEETLDLRRKALGTHSQLYDKLKQATSYIVSTPKSKLPPLTYKEFGSSWNENFGNALPALALTYILDGKQEILLDFIIRYMDRMVSYPSWYVIGQENDQVPVAHSLLGFSAAFDMIYDDLDDQRRFAYIGKLMNVTELMYNASSNKWWGHSHIQNHVATNAFALLCGSLVLKQHTSEAYKWEKQSITILDRTFYLLNGVTDGSLSEGVTYGSYASMSLLNFIFMCMRHYNHHEHLNNAWLRRHFDMYYFSIIPGFQYVLAVADAPDFWTYGPESQLYFLDSYVMKNGSGNWLANIIRERKKYRFLTITLHTDFLYYEPRYGSEPPADFDKTIQHTFTDWGVSVYRSRSILQNKSTYVSFKSSAIRGNYMHHLSHEYPEFIRNTNPGHEHPDQNSFTLTFMGEMFITEGFYGPKLTKANNVHMFYPSNVSSCSEPWAGQLGDCGSWLRFTQSEEIYSHGHLLHSSQQNGIFVAHGESSEAYHSSLGLESMKRTLALLDEELVVVFDSIRTKKESKLTHVSALFNNALNTFHEYQHRVTSGILQGFKMTANGKKMYFSMWLTPNGLSPTANISTLTYKSLKLKRFVSNVNVTFPIVDNKMTSVYIFCSDKFNITDVKFEENEAVELWIKANVSTNTRLGYYVSLDSVKGKLRLEKNSHSTDNDVISESIKVIFVSLIVIFFALMSCLPLKRRLLKMKMLNVKYKSRTIF